jgi:hypothetical protein
MIMQCELQCWLPALYMVRTNRIANPGKTPVEMRSCGKHVNLAVREQLRNNRSLRDRGMSGTDGVTVTEVT